MKDERNKKDFEKALSEMASTVEDLKDIIQPDILSVFDDVITEYDAHFKSDIEEMSDRLDELEAE